MDQQTKTAISKEFQIGTLLGTDWFGERYEARLGANGRRVLLKVMNPELAKDAGIATKLYNDLKMASLLSNSNLAKIITVGKTPPDTVYYAHEFLGNTTLQSNLTTIHKYPVLEALGIMEQILSALRAIHKLKLVHGYLNPANIFFADSPNGEKIVKLNDYAIVDMQSFIDHADIVKNYMSPEQALGEVTLDGRTDIFSAGVIFYELLSGKRAFEPIGDEDVSLKIILKSPTPLDKVAEDVPKEIVSIVNLALANDGDERYPTVDAFLKDIVACQKQFSDKPVSSRSKQISPQKAPAKPVLNIAGAPPAPGKAPRKMGQARSEKAPTNKELAPKRPVPAIKKTSPIATDLPKTATSPQAAKTTSRASSKKAKPKQAPQKPLASKADTPTPVLPPSPPVKTSPPAAASETLPLRAVDWFDDLDILLEEVPSPTDQKKPKGPPNISSPHALANTVMMSTPPLPPTEAVATTPIVLSVEAPDETPIDTVDALDSLLDIADPPVAARAEPDPPAPSLSNEPSQEALLPAKLDSSPVVKDATQRRSLKTAILGLMAFGSAKSAHTDSSPGIAESLPAEEASPRRAGGLDKPDVTVAGEDAKQRFGSKKQRIIAGAIVAAASIMLLLAIGLSREDASELSNAENDGASQEFSPHSMDVPDGIPPSGDVSETAESNMIDMTKKPREKDQSNVAGAEAETVQVGGIPATLGGVSTDRDEAIMDTEADAHVTDGAVNAAGGGADSKITQQKSKKKRSTDPSSGIWATNPFKKKQED